MLVAMGNQPPPRGSTSPLPPLDVERDQQLLGRLDAALAEGIRRSGTWVVCQPGCAECCLGPFEITALDAQRLAQGLAGLTRLDPPRAADLRARLATYTASDDAPCPALDPATRRCDLYAARPILCRLFGPAIRDGACVRACERCYAGATEAEIEACAIEWRDDGLETALIRELPATPSQQWTVYEALTALR